MLCGAVLRIGPYFMNFAYAYTLCHKEGHTKVGMFNSLWLQNVFNWWIGLFYGVMPSTFTYGHSRNHHAYNNDEADLVTTWDRPRDNFCNYLAYLPRWLLYHFNITAVFQVSSLCSNRRSLTRLSQGFAIALVSFHMFMFPIVVPVVSICFCSPSSIRKTKSVS
jgi:hypothetical protein